MTSFFLGNSNLTFPRSNIITNRVTEETKKRQKTNVNGSIVFNPIFIIGKDVPQRQPASNVKKTALALLLYAVFDTLSVPVF